MLIAHLGFFLYAAVVVSSLVLLCWGWAATDARGLVARRRVSATEVELDESGRQRAISVTGPEGDYVQGAPRPPRADDYDAKYDETY